MKNEHLLSPLVGALKPWSRTTRLSAVLSVRKFSANLLLCLILAVGRLNSFCRLYPLFLEVVVLCCCGAGIFNNNIWSQH